MEVISHLFYRLCVAQRPVEEQVPALRSWTGGAKARVPGQEVVYSNGTPLPDPPLELEHVLQVLDWLFTEVEITYWPETPHDDAAAPACYLTRLQCVNAQPLAAGLLHTKHRPYDMLAAVFLCANSMPATEAHARRLRAHEHRFMQMYLQQAQEFDYLPKDKYHHNSLYTDPCVASPRYDAQAGAQCVRVLACVPVAYSVWGGPCFGLEHKLFTARIQTPKHKPLPDHIGRLMLESEAALQVEHMLPLAPGIGARF